MRIKCETCGEELRGERIWDNYEKVIYHMEYYCQNTECSQYRIVLGTTKEEVIEARDAEIKERIDSLETAKEVVAEK